MAHVMALALALLTSASDEPIRDNSFLLEEAFNQEPGVIQHISAIDVPRDGTWEYTFTEEWPLGGEAHQLSFTLGAMSTGEATGISDWLLNYRLGVAFSEQVHLAPRLSLVIPTGDAARGLGFGSFGPETNVAFSVELRRILALHTNVGLTYLPSARNEEGQRAATLELRAGQSAIWLASHAFNLLVEALWRREQTVVAEGQTADERELLINPGARFAVELGTVQMVIGLGFPINVLERSPLGVFGYLSFEHPFTGERHSD